MYTLTTAHGQAPNQGCCSALKACLPVTFQLREKALISTTKLIVVVTIIFCTLIFCCVQFLKAVEHLQWGCGHEESCLSKVFIWASEF